MRDLTDAELQRWLASVPCAKYEPADMQCMARELQRHRAMVKRLEAWAESLESCPAGCMPPGDIAYELRDRMRTP